MKKNVGPLDRLIRMLLGNVLIFLMLFGIISGRAAGIAFIIAVWALLTSLFSTDPLYALVRMLFRKPG